MCLCVVFELLGVVCVCAVMFCVLCLMYCVVSSDVFCLFVSVCACACSKYVLDSAR